MKLGKTRGTPSEGDSTIQCISGPMKLKGRMMTYSISPLNPRARMIRSSSCLAQL